MTALNPKLVAHVDTRSPGAEAFRILRTNLQFVAVDRPLRSMLVTSAVPSEGKTTTAANLAIAFAQAGQKVLLVDADLRRPSLHQMFGMERSWAGLTSLLAGHASPDQVVMDSPVPGLRLLLSGPIPPNPAEVLGSTRMVQFMEWAREAHDLVILDSPPVMAVTDPCVLAQRADGVVLVTRVGQATRPQVQRAKAALDAVHARILGVVVNGLRRKGGSDYYYYYNYGDKG